MFLIDPPSPFAPADDWRAFAARMRELARENPNDATVKAGLRAAGDWESAQAGGNP